MARRRRTHRDARRLTAVVIELILSFCNSASALLGASETEQLTARSLPEIGRKIGGRDHTTVMHAVKKVEELRSIDASFAEDIDLLRRMLES